MADQQRQLKEWEVRWARAFLHALHGNESNGYLLRAVIAWMRAEGGGRSNPLGLTTASGTKLYYRSLYASAQAAVRRLQNPGPKDTGFRLIRVVAARSAASEADQIAQAQDFLYHVALSNWDARHYGMSTAKRQVVIVGGKRRLGPIVGWIVDKDSPEKNRILTVWYDLTGMRIPDKWFVDGVKPPPPPPKPAFRQDLASFSSLPQAERLDGYAAQRFLEERNPAGNNVLVD
jgi:hypothetical protein